MSGRRRLGVALAAAAVIVAATPAVASWLEVARADADLDLTAARAAALATVTAAPTSPDAVAAATWWLDYLELLPDPAAILVATDQATDPEVGLLLDQIDAELGRHPPASALATVELAGPFGHHGLLDLERRVVPADADLPPLGQLWRGPGSAFRLRLRTPAGRAAPPEPMFPGGVALAAWTVTTDTAVTGWLVVASEANLDLTVDDRDVARQRWGTRSSPATTWYAVNFAPGPHRLRVAMADRDVPVVRVHLVDDGGAPRPGLRVGEAATGRWGGSRVTAASPPAPARATAAANATTAVVADLLLAAELARGRGDAVRRGALVQRAVAVAPTEPLAQLALASYYLDERTDQAGAVDARAAREALAGSRPLAVGQFLEWRLAHGEQRSEDAERILEELARSAARDPRVLRQWILHAVQRGWTREADEALERLKLLLPESRAVTDLELAVLAGLERWPERAALLSALAARDDVGPRWVEQLAGDCFTDEALTGLRRLQARVDDPVLDIGISRLLSEAGRLAEAAQEVAAGRSRWGDLAAFAQLDLVLAATNPAELPQAVRAALAREPADLKVRTLAWRLGETPFYAPFRVATAPEAVGLDRTGLDSIMLLDQAVMRLFADGSNLYYYHGITAALTPEGARQAAVLQQPPDAELLAVRIVKPDGRVVVPPELAARNGTLVLADVSEGDLVEEEYVASSPPPLATKAAFVPSFIYRFADSERAVGLSEYVVVRPRDLVLAVDGNLADLAREELELGDLVATRWRTRSLAPIPREPLAPPSQELLPWLTLSFDASWQDVGDAARDRLLWLLTAPPELRAWAAPHLAAGEPRAALAALVAALCAEVEAGDSDLELRASAGESFSIKRGNRLGILAAILGDAGWTVDLVLARPRAFAGTHLVVPSFDSFTLPVLRVERGGVELWVDLGEELSGVDYLSPILQGSDGLALPLTDPGRPVSLVSQLPTFANPGLTDRTVVIATVAADGSAELAVELVLAGSRAGSVLERLASIRQDAEDQVYTQLAVGLFPAAEAVSGAAERRVDGAAIHLSFRLDRACVASRDQLECRHLVPAKPLVPALASLPERRFPLILQLPVDRRLELTVLPPEGFASHRPPRLLETTFGSVHEELATSGNTLRSSLVVTIPSQVVAPTDYPAFARFCQAVDALTLRPPVLTRTP